MKTGKAVGVDENGENKQTSSDQGEIPTEWRRGVIVMIW